MNVKIYTMTHKRFQKPESDIYISMHVGRALAEDLGYLGDNTGDNISKLNPYYGELTGLYWVWKNETDADIIGICHYRRYFFNESGNIMNEEEYETLLSDHDVIVSELVSNGKSNWDNYAAAHNAADMEAAGQAVKKLYPADYPVFCSVLSSTKCCFGNLMVTTIQKYREYCKWLFSILNEAEKEIDVSGYDDYHKRVFGFLSEVLLYVWITARGYRIWESRVKVVSEKAETVEFKQHLEQFMKEQDIDAAKKYFYSYLKHRPDIRLHTSDLHGEIPYIEKILFIINEEKKNKETGLLALSTDFKVLQEHYKNTYHLIAKYGSCARKAGHEYFSAFAVSETAYDIIEQDVNGKLALYDYLNEESRKKKVSVIVVVCGITEYFSVCIGNLVHQTIEDIEIIFIDTQSEPAGTQLLMECRGQFTEKVRVLNQADWNARSCQINGEYVLLVRSEDLPDTAICEKLYAQAEKTGWKLVGGTYMDVVNGAAKHIDMLWGMLIDYDIWEQNHIHLEIRDGETNVKDIYEKLMDRSVFAGNIEDIVYGYFGG